MKSDTAPGMPLPAILQPWWKTFDRQNWFIFSVAGAVWFFDCLDQQLFNLARDGAVESLLVPKERATEFASYTTSFLLAGWAVGGLIFGSMGDRWGRGRMLGVTLLVYSAFTGLAAFAGGFSQLCLCIFLMGVGAGGVFGLAVALVADSVPDRARAPALGVLQSLSTCGNMLGGMIGIGIAALAGLALLPFGLTAWQVFFLVGALPVLICVPAFYWLREPEKWIRAREDGRKRNVKFGSYRVLLGHPIWRRHAWLGLTFCCAGIVGLWGIGNFHPKIVRSVVEQDLAGAGLSAQALIGAKAHWASMGLLLQNIGGFCGMLSFAKLAQVVGRRPALAAALALSFLSTLLVFRFLHHINQILWMLPTMGFGQMCVFGVYAIYLPELFPTSLRSTGTSFCYNFGRLVAAAAPFGLGRLTRHLGGDIESFRTAGMRISVVLLVGLIALPFLPETKDRPLPEESP